MPENANNIPLDDEDILDLTVVAEPDKKSDGPPEPGMDFGADLDALLDSLGAGGESTAPPSVVPAPAAQPAPQAPAPPTAQAAPIADQTPVDHAVDPDEELAMPEMSDIDSLLAELGADVPAEPVEPDVMAEPEESAAPASDPDDLFAQAQAAAAAKPAPASAPMPEFDAILAQAQAADAAKATAAPAPAPAPASDIDDLFAQAQAADAAKAAPAPAPAKPVPASAPMPEFDSILAQAQAAEAAKAEEEIPAAPTTPEPAVPEPALPEPAADPFDAALSAGPGLSGPEPADAPVTADAPVAKAAPVVVSVSVTPADVAKAAPPAPVEEETLPADAMVDDPDDLDGQEEAEGEDIDLNELDALLDDILATAPEMSAPASTPAAVPAAEAVPPVSAPELIPVPDQAIMPVPEDVAILMNRVRRLEEAVEILESREITDAMVEGLIDAKLDAKIAAVFEPGSLVMEKILHEIRGQFADGAFNEVLEKMAAAAAAKVIREEIAALMGED